MPTATPFNNLITFSRGSNATVTGSNGLIQWAPNNILTSSQSFTTSGWFVDGAVLTPSTGVAPDGTTTATGIASGTGNNRVYQFDNSGVLGNKVFSLYVKAGVGSTVVIAAVGGMSPGGNATVNAATGTVSGLAGASVANVGNGWYRVSIPVNVTTASGNSTYWTIGATGGAVFIWGAQLELGSTATTYNPTTVKNLLGFSEAFSDASWTKVAASIVTGAQANPINGLFNAQKFMEGTANAQYAVFRSVAVGAAPHTFSMYAKLAPGTPRFFCLYPQGAGVAWAIFDLALGTTTAVSAINYISSSITPVGSGWYRCSITLNTTASNLFCNAYLTNSSGTPAPSYTGDGNSGVYIYGAQLSDSASLDPYVPTPGAAPSSTAFYGPRFDFDPVTLQPRGLLVEEQRTNLLLQSEAFGTTWLVSNATISSNVATSPDGTSNADKLVDNANPAQHFVYQSVVKAASSITYTLTSYMKSAEYTRSRLFLHDGAGNGFQADYNLATGTAGAAVATGAGWSAGSSAITPAGNGWYRCVITATSNTAASVESRINVLDAAGNANFTGTGTSGILLYGAQLEAGAFATSYIPTVASTVTRSADVATISGQNFGQWYGQPEGTFVVEYRQGEGTTARSAAVANDGTNNNTIELYIDGSTDATTLPFYGVYVGGVAQAALSFAAAAANSNHKMAGAYRTNDFAASVDGSSVATDTSGTLPTPTRLTIGANGPATGSFANGHIRSINYVPARAADFQLQALSALPIVDYFFLQTATGDQLVDGNGDELYSLPIFG